jgi:hypothetical protein
MEGGRKLIIKLYNPNFFGVFPLLPHFWKSFPKNDVMLLLSLSYSSRPARHKRSVPSTWNVAKTC